MPPAQPPPAQPPIAQPRDGDAHDVAEQAPLVAPEGATDQPVAAPAEADWLDRICPYLLSEDGTYRSTHPDTGHRCTAQDPPSTLPTAFQERFCLTERHVRCEMFKFAQSARSAALGHEGIPAAQVQSARFRPSVRSVPLALGPASGRAQQDGTSRRRVVVAAIGIAIVAIIVFFLVLALGGRGDGGGAPAASPSAAAISSPTPEPTVRPTPTPEATPEATPGTSSAPGSSPAASTPSGAAGAMIEYQVQEGEALIAIAETFGVSRRLIILANEGMAEKKPYTLPGDVIVVPVSADVALQLRQSSSPPPGFIRFIE